MEENKKENYYDDKFMEFNKMFDETADFVSYADLSKAKAEQYKDFLKYIMPWFIEYRIQAETKIKTQENIIEQLKQDNQELKARVQKESKVSDVAGFSALIMFVILAVLVEIFVN